MSTYHGQTSESPQRTETDPLLLPHDGHSKPLSRKRQSLRTWFTSLSKAYYISPIVFIMSLAFVLTTTTTLDILRQITCRLWFRINHPDTSDPTPDQCLFPGPKKAFSFALQVLSLINGLGTILSYGAIGRFSTFFGRKPTIIVLIATCAFATSCFLISVRTEGTLSDVLLIVWISVGTFCSPFSLGLVSSMYVVDIVEPEKRTSMLGEVQGHGILGLFPSYWLGGYITATSQNMLLVFWCQLILTTIAFLYAIFILPESFTQEKRDEALRQPHVVLSASPERPVPLWKKPINFILAVMEPLKALKPNRDPKTGKRNWRLLILTFSQLLCNTGILYVGESFLIYASVILDFQTDETGLVLTSIAAARIVVLNVGMPAVVKYIRPLYKRRVVLRELRRARARATLGDETETIGEEVLGETQAEGAVTDKFDFWITFWSCIVIAVTIGAIGLAGSRATAKFWVIATSLGAVHYPAMRSLVVASVPPVQSGEALAAVDMVSSLGSVFAPLIIGAIMTATITGKYPQLSFFVCAAFSIASSAVVLFVRSSDRYVKPQGDPSVPSEATPIQADG